MDRDEKRELRIKNWLEGKGINFVNPKAERLYKERALRRMKAMMCDIPDRVPVHLQTAVFPAYYSGYSMKRVMNDYKVMEEVWIKFIEDFSEDMDSFMSPRNWAPSATAMEYIDYKCFKWPGHGLSDDVNTFQFVENIIMEADEYDTMIEDPSDFAFRHLTPCTSGALKPLTSFPPLYTFFLNSFIAYPFADPNMRIAFQSLINAGEELEKWLKHIIAVENFAAEAGFPTPSGIIGFAPFDVIANYLRGTKGVISDMYRCPDKLMEVINLIANLTIKQLLLNINSTSGFVVNFPLHKGDDTFMSGKQFERFYWPSLKKVIDTLIGEGISMNLFAQGSYNHRLEYLKDFPKGWVTCQFDQTDLVGAKKIIGDTCCIAGNVPASIVAVGTPEEVKDRCRILIETCAPGGGYILSSGAPVTESNPENMRAFMEAANEYGVY